MLILPIKILEILDKEKLAADEKRVGDEQLEK